MKQNKKPFNPQGVLWFLMICGVVTLIAIGICLFVSFKMLTLGRTEYVMLPIYPVIVYAACAVAVTLYTVWKVGKIDNR